MSGSARERAQDVAFAQDLARSTPELLEVAASYDLVDFRAVVEHARRPAKSGAVLLATPPMADSGRGRPMRRRPRRARGQLAAGPGRHRRAPRLDGTVVFDATNQFASPAPTPEIADLGGLTGS